MSNNVSVEKPEVTEVMNKVAGTLNGLIPKYPKANIQYFRVATVCRNFFAQEYHTTILGQNAGDTFEWQIDFGDRADILRLSEEEIPQWCETYMETLAKEEEEGEKA